VEKLQKALDSLSEWASKWGMEFNVKKCKVMHVGHNNRKHVYTMGGQQLEETEEERDIGVSVMRTLKPAAQCGKAARTGQMVLGQLSRAFHYRDRHVFLKLYMQYVRPHLESASPAWAPWMEGDKESLEKVQRRAINMISGLRSQQYGDKLSELGLCTLEERRHQLDMVQTFKILKGVDNVDKSTWFIPASEGQVRVTRMVADPLNVRQQASRLDIRRQFYSQRVVDCWNRVPTDRQT
jgi:hypothetical protein